MHVIFYTTIHLAQEVSKNPPALAEEYVNYAMMSKHVKTEFDDIDMLTFDVGTIESIAMKTRDAFRDFQET